MLGWVVTFLVIALIAGILGFGGIAGASIEIAKIIFFIAVVLFLVSGRGGTSARTKDIGVIVMVRSAERASRTMKARLWPCILRDARFAGSSG
ncbi:uncharacterized membrane protein YtjA (UPF0391 family) [Bradyrhizobium sp. i1.4.4]